MRRDTKTVPTAVRLIAAALTVAGLPCLARQALAQDSSRLAEPAAMSGAVDSARAIVRGLLERRLSYEWPSGGYLSTVEELARFGSAHLAPGVLSAGSLRLMLTSQRLRDGSETGVGIAWRIGRDSAGRTIHHHGGASTGGRAFLLVLPAERVVVALAPDAQLPFDERDAVRLANLFLLARASR
jgi:CubicO group peptidase (beta-lactamase class C family)